MKNLKVIKNNELKDWADEIFNKNSFNMVNVSAKKRHLEGHWHLEKFMLEKMFLN